MSVPSTCNVTCQAAQYSLQKLQINSAQLVSKYSQPLYTMRPSPQWFQSHPQCRLNDFREPLFFPNMPSLMMHVVKGENLYNPNLVLYADEKNDNQSAICRSTWNTDILREVDRPTTQFWARQFSKSK